MLPLVVRVENLETNESASHVFQQSPVRIGRNELNELALNDRFTSFWHGIVHFGEDATEYVDLGSTNGTKIDGRVVRESSKIPLTEQTDLRIGKVRLTFSRRPAEATEGARNKTRFGMRAVDFAALQGPAALASTPAPQPAPVVAPAPLAPGLTQGLQPAFTAYRLGWSQLLAELWRALERVPLEDRVRELDEVARAFPPLLQEEQFHALRREVDPEHRASGAPPPGTAKRGSGASPLPMPAGVEGQAAGLLNTFAQTYSPRAQTLATPRDVETFLERTAAVLETFAKAFVELRRGQEQFGTEMAVRTMSTHTPLGRAQNGEEVLRYLLDWTGEGAARIQELSSGFAEVMIHQVAMLSGIREGIRALLTRLAPEALETELAKKEKSKLWPPRALQRFARAVESFHSFADEESQVQGVVFGPEFARAYALISGGKAPSESASVSEASHAS